MTPDIPTRWEIVAHITDPQESALVTSRVLDRHGHVWWRDGAVWCTYTAAGRLTLAEEEMAGERPFAVLQQVSDAAPPGGSGIAPESGYETWLREADEALNAAGKSTWRDDAANLDLAERIKTLRDERDKAHAVLTEITGVLDADGVAAMTTDVADRVRRLVAEGDRLRGLLDGADRALDHAGVDIAGTPTERIHKLANRADSARSELLRAYRDADEADQENAVSWDLPELAAQVVHERDELRAKLDAVNAATPSDDALAKAHAEGYHDGRRDGVLSILSELGMWQSRRIGEV